MPDYRALADALAADIAAGRLRPGDRLPTQRAYARRHRIAGSTAIRVYGELVRRGLVVGEVGRGTFVRAAPPAPGPALVERATRAPVNLELNYPVTEGQSELQARGLAALVRPDVLGAATGPAAAAGTPQARRAAAALLARGGWRPAPERVLFAGNGRQAIAAAVSSLVPAGGRLGVEELTYPLVKAVAERLGIRLVPIAVDDEGLRPDALAAAHRAAPLAAVYVQPTLHNPLAVTAGPERRACLAAVLGELGLTAVEDTTWAFLAPDAPAPLAAYAPGRTVLVDSLSKRLAPGLTVGYLVLPDGDGDGECGEGGDGAGGDGPYGDGECGEGGGGGGRGGGDDPEKHDAYGAEKHDPYAPEEKHDPYAPEEKHDPYAPEEYAPEYGARLARVLRSGAWTASGFALAAATRWTTDGTVRAVVAAKRADAAVRQRLVREGLAGFTVRTDPRAYYCWWELPAPWRAETFVAAAATRGIAVTPGAAFAVGGHGDGRGHPAPDAVRVGLASPPPPVLARALAELAALAAAGR